MSTVASGDASNSLPRNVKVIGLASLLNDVASEMAYPLLPHFLLTSLHGDRFQLGVIEGAADSVASFVKLWSGDQSDQGGRRKGLIIFGYCIPAFVRPLMGWIVAPWQLFGLRIFDRLGKGIRSSPRDALIADAAHVSARGRAFGFQRAMDNFGAAVGPLLATGFLWLYPEGLRTLFLLTFPPGLLVVILLSFGLKERAAKRPAATKGRRRLEPLNGPFRSYLIALSFFTVGGASDAFLLVRAGEAGTSTTLLPLLWCCCNLSKSIGNYQLGRFIDRVGPKRSLMIGWLAFACVYLGVGLAGRAWEIWILFVAYGLCCGLIEPAERAMVAHLVGAERKGLAYGWYNFALGIATLPSSLLFGALYQYAGPAAAFGWGASLSLLAAALLLRVDHAPGRPEMQAA